jgi:hypothetical protein
MKYLLSTLVALLVVPLASAQMRTIPKEAKVGEIRHLQSMEVEIDGRPEMLAPGAQIRDAENRVVLPASLAEKSHARYLVDGTGMVFRVWILTPREVAELPPPPDPK